MENKKFKLQQKCENNLSGRGNDRLIFAMGKNANN